MAPVKYIADGFLTDAISLLDDFSLKNSLEFPAFAEVWREHNFSYIYSMRENVKELSEFTQEIYKITGNFISSSSMLYQVGGVFLLYALYRNQIIKPLIQIRITQAQFSEMECLLLKACAEKLKSLHYILEFLFAQAFNLVACPTLMGPSVQLVAKRFKSDIEEQMDFSPEVKCQLTEIDENCLIGELCQSFSQYEMLRNGSRWSKARDKCNQLTRDLKRLVKESAAIQENAGFEKSLSTVRKSTVSSSNAPGIGSVRARLKAAAFSNTVYPDTDQPLDSDCPTNGENSASLVLSNHKTKIVRLPRCSRRKKKSGNGEDSDDSITKLVKQKLHKRGKTRCEKAPRIRHYFKQTPHDTRYAYEDCLLSSDVDDNLQTDILKNSSSMGFDNAVDTDVDLSSSSDEVSRTESVELYF